MDTERKVKEGRREGIVLQLNAFPSKAIVKTHKAQLSFADESEELHFTGPGRQGGARFSYLGCQAHRSWGRVAYFLLKF